MNVRLSWCFLAVVCCSTWSFAQEEAPPPPPGDEPRDARPDDRPPPPGDEGSPSDQRPDLNGRRTSRGYAGQAPGKQAPMQQGPYQAPGKQAPMQQSPQQAPGKQAPMQQGPMQAPGKDGAASYGGQPYTTGYANYNCAGCGDGGYQQTYYAPRTARRGLFGRRWR
jgi:hypothetical protein